MGGLCVASTNDAGHDGDARDASTDAPVDARPDADPDARPDAPPDAPPDANCDTVATNAPDGHHNGGQTCLQVGCHLAGNTGAGAPEYSIAGTLWRDSGGASPYPGATIEITVGGTSHKIVTATNGNFFLPPALAAGPTATMPGMTMASACPDNAAMAGALVDNGGNCNNCHRTGGTTTPIHLP